MIPATRTSTPSPGYDGPIRSSDNNIRQCTSHFLANRIIDLPGQGLTIRADILKKTVSGTQVDHQGIDIAAMIDDQVFNDLFSNSIPVLLCAAQSFISAILPSNNGSDLVRQGLSGKLA
jgi:hypothetical protein